ncbi:MAG: hydrogenase maturation protease [Planctomycetes bacterium]|nr:hydrogenase maturation protease [Planctomycetota bacterium]
MLRLVVGVGSPHGADQVGWTVVDRLKARRLDDATYIKVANPIDVLDCLGECDELILVDAVHGLTPKTIQCWKWPNQQITDGADGGSHGLGIVQVLELAGELQLLPKRVMIIGIGVEQGRVSETWMPSQEAEIDAIVEEVETLYA